MQRFDLAAVPPTPWKNGGGHTRELACWPPGAGMDAFEWRVSVATIAASGPFSAFPGVARQIMLLDGDGVQLQAGDGSWQHALTQRWQPFAFSGHVAVDCTLQGAESTDFNLMLRPEQWQGAIEVVHAARTPGSTPAGLCMVLSGAWHWGDEVLTPGQGLWWHSATASAPLQSAEPGQGGALAWIGLHPGI
jgi:environmental stress-induced protein Ves